MATCFLVGDNLVMGPGKKIFARVSLGQFFVAQVRSAVFWFEPGFGKFP